MVVSKLLPGLVTILLTASTGAPSEPLVTTEWVFRHLQDPKVRILDVSVDPGVYEKGHVPGAVGVRWHNELADPVRRDIVSAAGLEKLASRAGLTADSTAVVYGDNNNWFAAWGYWILKTYGHKDVRLMDGGRKKWEAEGRPLETTTPAPTATSYTVARIEAGLRARLGDVLDVAEGRKNATLVDVRSPDEFAGKIFAPQGIQELAIRAGHVPGAKSIPWSKTVREDGTFKPREELVKLYADAGVDGRNPVITYCRIGERSSHSWFVLRELLGFNVRNYDGSWTEYGNAVAVPIENPAGTLWTGK